MIEAIFARKNIKKADIPIPQPKPQHIKFVKTAAAPPIQSEKLNVEKDIDMN